VSITLKLLSDQVLSGTEMKKLTSMKMPFTHSYSQPSVNSSSYKILQDSMNHKRLEDKSKNFMKKLSHQAAMEHMRGSLGRGDYIDSHEAANRIAAEWMGGLSTDSFDREQQLTDWREFHPEKYKQYCRFFDIAEQGTNQGMLMGGPSSRHSSAELEYAKIDKLDKSLTNKVMAWSHKHPMFVGGAVALTIGVPVAVGIAAKSFGGIDLFGHPTPAKDYAVHNGIQPDVAAKISHAMDGDGKMSSNEQTFIDGIAKYDTAHQSVIANGLLSDGEMSANDSDQMQFIHDLPHEESLNFLDSGHVANYNIDGDMAGSNRFEQLTGTPYNTKNSVYAIVMTISGHEYGPVDEMFKMLDGMGVPKSNVYDLSQEKNNSVDFEAAAADISHKAGPNDKVIVLMNGHGLPGEFHFRDDTPDVTYKWFNDKIGKINADKIAIVIDACHSGSAIEDLEGPNRLILTDCSADEKGEFGMTREFLKAFSDSSADKNGNGYVSIGEAAEHSKEARISETKTPQISDKGNIGAKSYLAEIKVGK
jgi:hypothetical protein